MKNIIIISWILIFTLQSCSFPTNDYSMNGEEVTIKLKNGLEGYGELYSVSTDKVYYLDGMILREINFYDIDSIILDRLSGNPMLNHSIIFQLLPAVLLAVAASIEGVNPGRVLLIFSLPGLITLASSTDNTEDVEIKAPFDETKINNLRKYCRYFYSLSDKHIRKIMEGQKGFKF